MIAGKGFYLWKILYSEGGDPAAIAATAKAANLRHVLIKVANGRWRYNFDGSRDLVPEVAEALRALDIEVWGWHYLFGGQPEAEADVANLRAAELGLDGYVLDAEAEYKKPGMAAQAERFFARLDWHNNHTIPLALSSYRYPSLHREFPWGVFMAYVDFAMPQVYWIWGTNPGGQLLRTIDEYAAIAPTKGVIPTGAAFKEHGWKASPAEVVEFMDMAKAVNMSAVNFWEWANCRAYLPEVWQVISAYDWPGDPEPPPSLEQRVERLEIEARARGWPV